MIIGIAGGSASGKSTYALSLKEHFNDVYIISMDDYYKDQSHLSMKERLSTNYDHPDALDLQLLYKQLLLLKEGHSIHKPKYDFVSHNRCEEYETVHPHKIIVVEGLFVLYDKDIRDICDITIGMNISDDIGFIRRLLRDVNERGRDVSSVCTQYLETVRPMYKQYIEPSLSYAQYSINNDKNYDDTHIILKIRSLIE